MATIEERADRTIYEPTDGHPLKACENELRRLKTLLNESGVPSNIISVGGSLSNIRKEMEE